MVGREGFGPSTIGLKARWSEAQMRLLFRCHELGFTRSFEFRSPHLFPCDHNHCPDTTWERLDSHNGKDHELCPVIM